MCAYCYEDPEGKYRYEVPDGKTEKTVYFEPLKGRPHGSDGGIYKIVTRERKEFALKVFSQGDEGQAKECRDAEAEALQKLNGAGGHAPKLYSKGTFFERKGGSGRSCGFPAFLMEFVPEDTLEDAIKNGLLTSGESHLDGRRTLEVTEKVCEAVAACHSPSDGEGSVHRDLKPSNIMIEASDGSVSRVAIVGWSKATLCSNSYTSASQETVAYAAPELLRAAYKKNGRGKASASGLPTVDVWSLGAIAYFVRTGKDPSLSDDPNDQTEKTLAEYADYREQHPISLPNCKDDNDERLNEFIRRCTENDYKKRPQDAGGVKKYLVKTGLEETPYPIPASKPKHRKRIVAILAAAIAIAASIAVMSGLRLFDMSDAWVTGVTPKASVEDYSWAELAAISDVIAQAEDEDAALKVAKRYNLVNDDGTLDGTQTKSVTLTDGTETSVQIVGFAHDDKSDGSGKAGITFIFTDAIALHAMNSEESSDGGWEASEARSWLSSDGKSLLPEELQDVLVAVDKYTNNVGETEDVSSVTSTSDELWLFSYVELAGPLSYSYSSFAVYNGEGSQYKLFSDQQIARGVSNDLLVKTYLGGSESWWTRSPIGSSTDYFMNVSGGDPWYKSLSNESRMIVPGFCISGSTSALISEEDSEVWGPTDRETFTWSSPASYITFNSITDNPTLGDERNFVRVREAGVGVYSDSVEIEDGKTYEIYIYYHNNASSSLNESGDGLAQNVTLSSEFPSQIDSGDFGIVSATISSTSSTPASVWGSAYLINKTNKSLYLRYVHDSAVITNDGSASGSILDADSLFSESGAFLAYWSDYWGIIPGCNDYAGYVVYQVVAESVSGDTLDAL